MSEAQPLLVVEDDPGIQRQLRWTFEKYRVVTASDRETAVAALKAEHPAVVTLDLGLPPEPDGATEGLATLEAILAAAPHTKVVVVSGNEDRQNAVRAVALGAYDFYQKPIEAETLSLVVERAFHLSQLEEENRRLLASEGNSPLRGVIASSPEMLKVCRMVEKVAGSDVGVLLLGESGTGKEVLARAIHELSPRHGGPFVAINCGAIPETLLESELFGHEKGAFTGAVKQTLGKVELAQGGTLFLDEIGDLPLQLQVKLLRFLQDKVIERIGGRKEIPIDARIVCATNQNLADLIAAGKFREDLYYRLTEIVIDIPPLRGRGADSVLIAKYLLNRLNREHGRNIRGFSDEAAAAIIAYKWPGNVRELENRVKRAVIMTEGKRVTAEDLGLSVPESAEQLVSLKEVREDAERRAILRAFSQVDGNISKAAKLLGISRPTLYNLMREYHIED